MPFLVTCPKCAVRINTNEAMIGVTVTCPKCKTPMLISAPPRPNAYPPTSSPMAAGSFNQSSSGGVTQTTGIIVALVGCALFCVILLPCAGYGLFSMLRRGGGTDPSSVATQPQSFASTAGTQSTQAPQTQPSEEDRARANAEAERIAQEIAAQATQRLVEQMRNDAANLNIAAWKEMRQCDNRYERLSRESPIEYWESMREGYGAIDTQGVDDEFVSLLQSYRELFLTFANTQREWNRERDPLVNALNNAKQPESFGEGLLIGFAGGVTIAMVQEIDDKYQSKNAGLKTQLESLQATEASLRSTLSDRYGVQFP